MARGFVRVDLARVDWNLLATSSFPQWDTFDRLPCGTNDKGELNNRNVKYRHCLPLKRFISDFSGNCLGSDLLPIEWIV